MTSGRSAQHVQAGARLREMACAKALREWRNEARRLGLSEHETLVLMPKMAKAGWAEERRSMKRQQRSRIDHIHERGEAINKRAKRISGLAP